MRPCRERWNPASEGRFTSSLSSSISMIISGWNSRVSSPLGPLTVTLLPSILTSVPGGTVMGALPILDNSNLRFSRLPHVGQDLSPHVQTCALPI